MQRGAVRPRSPSAEGDNHDSTLDSRPKQRVKASSLSASSSPGKLIHNSNMGHPLHANGSSPTNGISHENEAGPSSSNGHASSSSTSTPPIGPGSLPPHVLGAIQSVSIPGNLMYEDDRDWAEHDHASRGDDDKNNTDDEMDDDHRSPEHDRESRPIGKRPAGRPGVGGGKRMPIEREEAVRLMLQGLRDIGYHQAADVLEVESGYQLSESHATDFQLAILGGRWSEAIALLPELGIPPSPATNNEPGSPSSSIASGKTKITSLGNVSGSLSDQANFLIAQQKYLEYLEIGQQKKALGVLRGELARVAKDQDVLHTLSGFMMCLDKEDLYQRATWDGSQGTSRRQLLEHLQAFISPQVMVPSRRLATLFDQARRHQQLSCLYHEEPESISLYTDHKCESGQFPSVTTHILADHTDEVWRIEWSPDGMFLASAGKDKTVVIWQLTVRTQYSVKAFQHLKEQTDPVDSMAWSPDGKTLVIAADKNVYVWDVKSGELRPRPSPSSQHGDTISAIQWLPDGSEFVVASMDCKVVFYAPTGNLLRQWSTFPLQLNDFVVTPDGKRIVAITTPLKRVSHNDKLKQSMSARPSDETETIGPITSIGPNGGPMMPFQYATMEHSIAVIRIADHEIIDWSQDLRCETTSIKISSDGRKVIVSCTPDEIQVWSIDPGLRYLRKHSGHVQGHFLIRSCFGAPKDRFVLSGSEDGHVYVWQGSSPNPIEVLSGHTSVVNSVAWNPVAARRIFASCSDDSTIRIWQPPLNLDDPTVSMVVEAEAESGVLEGNGNHGEVEADEDEGMIL
uniref:WD-repeat protein n=1 Tax=Kwoniella dejecticola CBS 10117 TaxID=1296121 RepID=A0A1A6A9Z0_9TREE|nr:WD-repeat protein [Kwoniella dejecticola CBS 10117]OBR86880.1 WD-repeat protein [Kwoniella dejecticola CBS 10117]